MVEVAPRMNWHPHAKVRKGYMSSYEAAAGDVRSMGSAPKRT